MKNTRNQLHNFAMILIYQALTYSSMDVSYDLEKMFSNQIGIPYSDIEPFLKELVIKSLINEAIIIDEIQHNMPNWKFKRINRLAQAILLLAVAHYRYVEKVDKRIVIDNAVHLAKKYLDEGDYRLINAVLDATL